MRIIPFQIYTMKKEKWYHQRYRDWATQKGITKYANSRNYCWLFFGREVPEELGWKKNQKLVITLNEEKDLLAQPLTKELLKAFCRNPSKLFGIVDLRDWPPDPSKVYIEIPRKLIRGEKFKRAQPLALTGINNSQLLITKPPGEF